MSRTILQKPVENQITLDVAVVSRGGVGRGVRKDTWRGGPHSSTNYLTGPPITRTEAKTKSEFELWGRDR